MSKTSIEWVRGSDGTQGETWNPTVGCSRVSPGCSGCYAIDVAHRAMQPAHEGLTIKRPGERTDWTGEVRCLPDRLTIPLRRRKPTTWFVDSMSDLFHPDVPYDFIDSVFAIMALTPQHTYQVLTKRPHRMSAWANYDFLDEDRGDRLAAMAEYHSRTLLKKPVAWDARITRTDGLRKPSTKVYDRRVWPGWPLPNAWLGASIELDKYAFRADHLRAMPAAVRFLSLEPLLGPLPSLDLTAIDWVIVGGESGPGARPMHPRWVRDIRDRCVAANVSFLFKQWGAYGPFPLHWPEPGSGSDYSRAVAVANDGRFWPSSELAVEYLDGGQYSSPFNRPFQYVHETGRRLAREGGHLDLTVMHRVGKKKAGRDLDDRVWDEMPTRVS